MIQTLHHIVEWNTVPADCTCMHYCVV